MLDFQLRWRHTIDTFHPRLILKVLTNRILSLYYASSKKVHLWFQTVACSRLFLLLDPPRVVSHPMRICHRKQHQKNVYNLQSQKLPPIPLGSKNSRTNLNIE